MTRSGQVVVLSLGCLCAAVLTGCNNESPEAGRPNTAAPASTARAGLTESPSQSTPRLAAPVRPAAADGLTLAAGEAFINYYSELMNYASATGDAAPLLSESDAGCQRCKRFVSSVKKSNGANGLLAGDYRERIKEISAIAIGEGGHLGADMVVTVGQFTRRDASSASPVNSEAKTYFREIALSPRSGRWVMFEVRDQEQ
ncbi:DUF6318 family protein [Kribbella ginsengisoli]|uniref:DUF6318 domain-containing protein n=1 Tax=Kribbella ginsengisoli TaxID=363865 RepID=A0ABP6YC62_9ACTN